MSRPSTSTAQDVAPSDNFDALRKQDVAMRRMFADTLLGPEYGMERITRALFSEALCVANERNWIHPTRMAEAVGSSVSNVHKWFHRDPATRSAPAQRAMQAMAVCELAKLVKADADRIEADLDPVNHKRVTKKAPRLSAVPPLTTSHATQGTAQETARQADHA